MSFFSWIFGGEDKVTRCGWKMLSIYSRTPKKDPYYAFCEWDDNATTEGSFEGSVVPLERHVQAGLDQINLLQKQFPPSSFEFQLGQFYKAIWPHVVGLFRE